MHSGTRIPEALRDEDTRSRRRRRRRRRRQIRLEEAVLFCFGFVLDFFWMVLFCFVLFCFVLFCFVLFCFVLFCLFCFVLFCFVLVWCVFFFSESERERDRERERTLLSYRWRRQTKSAVKVVNLRCGQDHGPRVSSPWWGVHVVANSCTVRLGVVISIITHVSMYRHAQSISGIVKLVQIISHSAHMIKIGAKRAQ
jgi:hypothetical protein